MKFTPKSIRKLQEGGPVEQAAPEAMPAPEAAPQQDPLVALVEMAMQALQSQDCAMMAQVCEGLIQLVQQMAGPAPEAPAGEPVFRKGGILTRRIKK